MEQHKIEITTKREATRVSVTTIFKPVGGKTATTATRYDRGKYAHNHRGRMPMVSTDVIFVHSHSNPKVSPTGVIRYCVLQSLHSRNLICPSS